MPKINGKTIFDAAKKHGFIVGAFNIRHPNGLEGIARAAAETDSTFVCELARSELGYTGWTVETFARGVAEIIESVSEDVVYAVHADHITVKNTEADQVEGARKQIAGQLAHGWTSFAIDASHNENEDNLRLTRELARPIVEAGWGLEVEIGEIGGKGGFSTPEEAEWFIGSLVEAGIHPDLLAINNGSVHGNYGPGKGEGIQLDLTRRIGETIWKWNVGIAQHGITGTPLDKIGQFADYYIFKGNVGTFWQNINFGLAMDPNGNTRYDDNGHFVKLDDEGIPTSLWEEFLAYMDENGIDRGSGNVKKLNAPFHQKMLDLAPEYHERINQRAYVEAKRLFEALRAVGTGAHCRP